MKTLLWKEFLWNWRSFRFPALLLVFLFHALLDPLTIRYMPEILEYIGEFEIIMPDMLPEDAVAGFLSSISQIGILVLIIISMGQVAKEKESGVTGWMLSKPVKRLAYLSSKVINLYSVVIVGIASAVIVGYFYTKLLMGPVDTGATAWAALALITYALFIASITFFLSTIMKTPLQAGGLAILVFFLSGALQLIIGSTAARRFYPNTLLSEMGNLVYGITSPAELAIPLLTTFCLCLLLIAAAVKKFSSMEI